MGTQGILYGSYCSLSLYIVSLRVIMSFFFLHPFLAKAPFLNFFPNSLLNLISLSNKLFFCNPPFQNYIFLNSFLFISFNLKLNINILSSGGSRYFEKGRRSMSATMVGRRIKFKVSDGLNRPNKVSNYKFIYISISVFIFSPFLYTMKAYRWNLYKRFDKQ